MKPRIAIFAFSGAVALMSAFLPTYGASAAVTASSHHTTIRSGPARAQAPNVPAPSTVTPKGSNPQEVPLPAPVSTIPANWTPNVSVGSCGKPCQNPGSVIYDSAVVNGEVVVGGAFGQVCSPSQASPPANVECPTQMPVSFLFAFSLSTGQIDQSFTPQFDTGPIYSVIAGPNNTVYVGGAFNTVNGTASEGLAQISVTPGQSTDGQLVPGFAGTTNGAVTALAWDGNNALYVAGEFSRVDGVLYKLERINATTGALDGKKAFAFTLSNPAPGQVLKVKTLALSSDGTMLAIAGTFLDVNGQSDPRLALINTGGGLGQTATLDNWGAPILSNNCAHQHDYINGVDFSPDGSYLVIADTGYLAGSNQGICDATARFNTTDSGLNVQPYWVNYDGADTLRSVAVTSNAVYIGGHDRWANNECGQNRVCEQNAVLVDGIAALDPATGLALPYWHPQTARGVGTQSLVPFGPGQYAEAPDGGLIVGAPVNSIGGQTHGELAIFPMTTATAQTPGGPILSGMFLQGRLGGLDETSNGVPQECVDDAGNSSTPGSPVQLVTCANDNEQNWTINSDQSITINGLCLDAPGGTSGSAVVVNTCDSATSQQWQQGAGNILTNVATGLCLDDPGSSSTSGTALDIATCSGAAGQSWPLPISQAPPAPPVTGPFYSILLQHTEVPCMAMSAKNVQIATCLGKSNEEWTLQTNGTLTIGGKCLDTVAEATTPGTLTTLATCNGSATQTWTYQITGRSLTQQGSGLCLDDPNSNTNDGTKLDIATCTDGTNQKWLEPEY